jgi:hypothetical protein
MDEERILKELDRIHDSVRGMDSKLDKLRDQVYEVGTNQATYFERVDNLVSRVGIVESEQKISRRLAISILATVVVTLLVGLAQLAA